ncbi:hypothetical protein K466DRAFT_569276 [Polyporus arcularius HHB13444]|uniref:Uncharacterized protein n=1 Tax=Polyporus arcularius HHB13444 TaxID=1314778 RepID=A0A5C3NUN4_9APHY|nr:hypothetical protein K466DRAFT_569276 [Polyporus arcularius HHB13444]
MTTSPPVMSTLPSTVSSGSDSPSAGSGSPAAVDPNWDSLSTEEKQAYYHAETGRVCIGPVGAPVSGLDRLILQIIQEEAPHVMKNWFEESYHARFYTMKLTGGRDASAANGPRYALYRATNGPAILTTWSEVARNVVGVPGSLYQKCSSHIEASLRLMQAWQIGGINARIDLATVMRPSSTDVWLQGFAASEGLRLRISEEDQPEDHMAPFCSPDGIDELLDPGMLTGGWEMYVPGRKPAMEYTSTMVVGSLQPLLSALQTAASAVSEQTSAVEPSSSPVPKLIPNVHSDGVELWLPPTGSGHHTEEGEVWQDSGLRLGHGMLCRSRFPPPMGRNAKYQTDAERQQARREQKARYAQSPRCSPPTRYRGLAAQSAARARHTQRNLISPMTVDSIAIPDALRAYATMPFVMSFGFPDITGPSLGLRHPPYTFRLPHRRSLASLERRGRGDPLIVKLETLQFSWAISAGAQRRLEWAGQGLDEIISIGRRELAARVLAWAGMERRMAQLGAGDAAILDVAMRWGARLAMTLAEELEIRGRGEEAWVAARHCGDLPLQRLVRENRLRIESLPTDDQDSDDDV